MHTLKCKCGDEPEIKIYATLSTIAAVCPTCGRRPQPVKYTEEPTEASDAAKTALRMWNEMIRQDWRYVEDGNPAEPGTYHVTIIYPEMNAGEKTGRMLARVTTRDYIDIDDEPNYAEDRMTGEPDHGMVWTRCLYSEEGETVWAWKPMEEIEIAELPEGVEVDGAEEN